MKKYLLLLLLAFSSLTACKFKTVISNGTELTGEGITFLVPSETSSSSSGTGGITFDGESVKAKTDGKTLTVNGENYGPVAAGDKVDLRTKGKVTVNGVAREAVKKAEEKKP